MSPLAPLSALLTLLLWSSPPSSLCARTPEVTLVQGSLTGTTFRSRGGRLIYGYLGVPYGRPPTGDLRFERPVAAGPWPERVLDASRWIMCPQNHVITKASEGVEDCLVLNVYTTQLPGFEQEDEDEEGNYNKDFQYKAVMVWIHGGAFFMGSGTPGIYGPEFFMDHDIVLVTINYRLGPLGFLSMGDEVLPGNLGLWDQRLALQWVQENVGAFGGDPERVTIFGESAGAMSATMHLLSPLSAEDEEPLFHRVIAQSGVATSPYCSVDKHPAYYARTLADHFGCNPAGNSKAIKDCLRKVSASDLVNAGFMFQTFDALPYPFKPVVDDFASEPFLPREPVEIIESGDFRHVPVMFGSNKEEGLIFTGGYLRNQSMFKELSSRWGEIVPLMLFGRESDEVAPEERELSEEILADLFPGGNFPNATQGLEVLTAMLGDVFFNSIGSWTGMKLAEVTAGDGDDKAPIFEYSYEYQGSYSLTDVIVYGVWKLGARVASRLVNLDVFSGKYGVCHSDEVFLQFRAHILPIETVYTAEDRAVSAHLLGLWTNFAKFGDPTPDWEMAEVGAADLGVRWPRLAPLGALKMHINTELTVAGDSPEREERHEYWSGVLRRFPPRMRLLRSPTWSHEPSRPTWRRRAEQARQPQPEASPFGGQTTEGPLGGDRKRSTEPPLPSLMEEGGGATAAEVEGTDEESPTTSHSGESESAINETGDGAGEKSEL